jgi:hypothetical protein
VIKVNYYAHRQSGRWALRDADWEALEGAGWMVLWVRDREPEWANAAGRHLGSLATGACKQFESVSEGLGEFESVTGQKPGAIAPDGEPWHEFSYWDDDLSRQLVSSPVVGGLKFS